MKIFCDFFKEKVFTRIQLSITLVLILFLSVTGATYAYFAISISNSVTINGEAATVNLTLDVTKVFPTENSNNTGVIVPQLSTSGSSNSALASALKNGCIDGNNNVICQVYRINIQNLGATATQVVDGSVTFYGNATMTSDASLTIPNLRWKLINSVDVSTPSNSVLGTNADLVANASDDNIFANDIIMEANSIFTYYMIVWLNETGDVQESDAGKQFFGKITFESSNGTGVTSAFSS